MLVISKVGMDLRFMYLWLPRFSEIWVGGSLHASRWKLSFVDWFFIFLMKFLLQCSLSNALVMFLVV